MNNEDIYQALLSFPHQLFCRDSLIKQLMVSSLYLLFKGGEQSERTPPECSVKWPPMNENT